MQAASEPAAEVWRGAMWATLHALGRVELEERPSQPPLLLL